LVASYTLSPRFAFLGELVYGRDEVGGADVSWYGLAAALRYEPAARWALSPRYEWFVDDDGFTTGLAQTVQEVTVTAEYRLSPLVARAEVRTDFSDQPFFPADDGLRRTRTTMTFGFLYAFSTRK
jgi:hypothetical protein